MIELVCYVLKYFGIITCSVQMRKTHSYEFTFENICTLLPFIISKDYTLKKDTT